MIIKFKMSEKSKRQFSPLKPGWYQVEIFDAVMDRASTGTEFLNIGFKVQTPKEESGQCTWGNFYFTEDATWKIAALQNAIGMEPGSEFDTEDLIGKTLRIRLKDEEDLQGNPRNEVVAFRKLPLEKAPF